MLIAESSLYVLLKLQLPKRVVEVVVVASLTLDQVLSKFQVSCIIFLIFCLVFFGTFRIFKLPDKEFLFPGVDCRELPICSTDTKTTQKSGSGGSSLLNLRSGAEQIPG